MTGKFITHIRNFLLLALVQVLIFSQIHLFGYATIAVYLIFLLKLPRHTTCNELLLWGFSFGLVVDMFCNTPGLNAAAATGMAFARNMVLAAFTHKGNPDNFTPSVRSLKWGGYIVYSFICIAIFFFILFTLELFTISNWSALITSTLASTMATMVFAIVAECFSRTDKA